MKGCGVSSWFSSGENSGCVVALGRKHYGYPYPGTERLGDVQLLARGEQSSWGFISWGLLPCFLWLQCVGGSLSLLPLGDLEGGQEGWQESSSGASCSCGGGFGAGAGYPVFPARQLPKTRRGSESVSAPRLRRVSVSVDLPVSDDTTTPHTGFDFGTWVFSPAGKLERP